MQIPKLFSKCILSLLIPSILAQPLYGYQVDAHLKTQQYRDPLNASRIITYDEVLQYLADIESGVLESKCNFQDLERINAWLVYLARSGVIPGDIEAINLLEADIEELDEQGLGFEFASYIDDDAQFMLIPSITAGSFEAFICKSWISKKWKQTKKFVKEHKKEILIGAAVVVAATVVVVAVACGMGAAAASAATTGVAAAANSHDRPAAKASDIVNQTEVIRSDVLSQDLTTVENKQFPMEENARILGQAASQAAFQKLQNSVSSNSYFSSDLQKLGGLTQESCHLIDEAFSKPIPWYSWDYSNSFKENVFAARGAYASDIKLYDQACLDFNKALKLNPHNSDVYLNRALTYFETGEIDKATADFKKHVELRPEPIKELKDFSLGFARGLGQGVKDSGKGLYEFAGDVVFHPVSTAVKMYESGQMLFELSKSSQWAEIAQVLSKEAFELATQWESLSYERRGELSGYVFGKHGADLLIPGIGIKVIKGAMGELKLLANAANAASKAEKALVLESVAIGFGNIADASFGVKTAAGLTGLGEVGFLKHIEHLKNNQMFNFTSASLKHMQEPTRWVPMHLMKEVIEHPLVVVPDPRKTTNANMYYSQISRNGKLYNIEVLYDPLDNTVYHFMYSEKTLGPLKQVN
jgi:tetratricopeptide (TPR) repeat protein